MFLFRVIVFLFANYTSFYYNRVSCCCSIDITVKKLNTEKILNKAFLRFEVKTSVLRFCFRCSQNRILVGGTDRTARTQAVGRKMGRYSVSTRCHVDGL